MKISFEFIFSKAILKSLKVPLKYFLGFCFLLLWNSAGAQNEIDSSLLHRNAVVPEFAAQSCDSLKSIKKSRRRKVQFKTRKGIAALFAVTLGPFGVHRMYLGTSEMVPLFYSLTLGGLMILPFVDLCCILFTKDIEVYKNNHKVIMW
ncbi:MAG: TM2 domain-containing protein [Flavobacteriales bacterium]|nr:TM2 domain-containing protein [Flavobacteriales bacterium]